jgi:hypothetical protein
MTDITAVTPLQSLQTCLREIGAELVEMTTQLHLLAACRYAPPSVIDAAVQDLTVTAGRLADLESLRADLVGEVALAYGLPADPLTRLRDLEAVVAPGDRFALGSLRQRLTVAAERVAAEAGALDLELGRVLADLHEVERMATGAPGTYDATGRRTGAPARRARGVV